jgi:hypothetical protein
MGARKVTTPELDVQFIPNISWEDNVWKSETQSQRRILKQGSILSNNGACVAVENFDRYGQHICPVRVEGWSEGIGFERLTVLTSQTP